MATSTSTKARTDSTDRTPALALAKTVPGAPAKAPVARFGGARRLLTALMRSLATPHV